MKQKLDFLKENQPGNKKQKNNEQQKRKTLQLSSNKLLYTSKMKSVFLAFCILALATMTSAARLSMNQMAVIWKQNGGMDCETAVAVGWATSMGNTNSRMRSRQGGVDRGVWGINSVRSPGVSVTCARSADCGATAAIGQSMNGADWSKFSAFNNGMHMPHMQRARMACGPSGFDMMEEEAFDLQTDLQLPVRRLRGGKHLSMHQMAMLWKRQGGMDCSTAVAIGWATSMGNTKAKTRSVMGGKDQGLWGINSISASHVSRQCAMSADCNTGATLALSSNGADWSQFSAYVNGMHLAHMHQSRAACR